MVRIRYKKIGYNMDILRQTACIVVNSITVHSIVGRCLIIKVCGRAHRGRICGFLVFWLQRNSLGTVSRKTTG